jgi:hypothetical protein
VEYKNQHFIPQGYLKPWRDPSTPEGQTPYVWQFSKDGRERKKKAPKKIFYEKDMYTVHAPDGSRDLALEKGLSQLEGMFVDLRDSKLENDRALDADDALVLTTFTAAMFARTRARATHVSSQWRQVLDLAKRMEERLKEAPEIAKAYEGVPSRGQEIPIEVVKQIVERPAQTILKPSIDTLAPILLSMNLVVLVTDETPGFITSDAPCVILDGQARLRPQHLRSPDPLSPDYEVRLPVSPRRCVVFTWRDRRGYVKVPPAVVDEINRLTRAAASKHFVVNSDATRDIWFVTRRTPPAKNETPAI